MHKNKENDAIPKPKISNNRKSFGNLGVHKNEQNHALPEPKKMIKKIFKNWFWECIKMKKNMHSQLGVHG